ncbi:MAG: hypothetical protein JKY53_11945 [Flavobacteriales bacterium]|nr:hypothetical protein [Flavobacteriales bacterium]
MKLITSILVSTMMIFGFTSCSKVNNKDMVVIKDCTGSYLRFNGKDYHICNLETVANFESETEVQASFKKSNMCSSEVVIVCRMVHENEGWVYVTKIE